MHLLVLSAFRLNGDALDEYLIMWSQCTFWCSVLSDSKIRVPLEESSLAVSMHLLVLSAF